MGELKICMGLTGMSRIRFLIFTVFILMIFDAGICRAAEDSSTFSKLRSCVAALAEIGTTTIPLPAKLSLEEAAGWITLRRQLAANMKRGDAGIKSFALDASSILSINREDLGRHGVHGAVHDALTKQGPATLKVYKESEPPSYVGLYIQTVMGELGLGPKVLGTINGETLWKRFGIRRSYGLVMESLDIDGSVEWKYKGGKKPEMTALQIEAAEKRLLDAARVFSYLHIIPGDLDAVITKSGELFLIDFDAYYWVSDKGEVVRNTNVGDYPIPPLDSQYPKSLKFWSSKNRLIDSLINSIKGLNEDGFGEKIKFGGAAPSLETAQALSGKTFNYFKKGKMKMSDGSVRTSIRL